uniref:Uncharacterized protein n=1 Tax=Arundo donax TaxID=35708 RepID=A0A0A9AZX2_ARUDO
MHFSVNTNLPAFSFDLKLLLVVMEMIT